MITGFELSYVPNDVVRITLPTFESESRQLFKTSQAI